MYPSGENYATLMSVAFLNALQDANMLVPTGVGSTLLFPTARVGIKLGGDAAMIGSNDTVKLPLNNPSIVLTIGRSYGSEQGYAGADPYVDVRAYVPFSVWTNDGASQDDMEQRLEFARQHRQNVFSSYGLNSHTKSMVGAKPRPASPITGLLVVDYRWEFYYSRA